MTSTDRARTVTPILRPRMPELDTLRGIAILSVFVFHAFDDIAPAAVARPFWQRVPLAVANQGWAGVNLFFVLSGFLIAGILLDSRDKPRYYSRFYSHRALRILPPYYLMLGVLFLLGHAGMIPVKGWQAFLGLSFIYLSNVTPLFGVPIVYWPLWSLAVEEHFYLLWPTIVRFVSRRWLAIIAVLICLVEPLVRFWALHEVGDTWWGGPQRTGSFRYTWMYADGLALGALLAIYARSAWGRRNNFLKLAVIAAGVTAIATILSVRVSPALAACLRGTLVNYGALALLAGFLWLGTGVHSSWANMRLLAFYGYISYGFYLVHGLILDLYRASARVLVHSLFVGTSFGRNCIEFAICLGVITAIAYVSRVTFEEYFLRRKDRSPKVRTAVSSVQAA